MRRALPTPLGLAFVALAAAACGGHATSSSPVADSASGAPPALSPLVSCTSFAPPSATATMRQTLYTTLVTNRWSYAYCSGGGTGGDCTVLTLDAAGTYELSAPAGYSSTGPGKARLDTGHWNFAALDDANGLVCFDGTVAAATHDGGQENLPSVLHFTLPGATNDNLQIGPYSFASTAVTTFGGAPTESLPNVTVSPGFAALVGAEWKKTNAFDVAITPESVLFDSSGHFTASFGGQTCARSGFISYDRDTMLPQDDSAGTTGTTCTTGNYAPGFQGAIVPGFFDDLVVLGQGTYRKSDAAPGKPNAFVFDPYGRSVRVTGSYDGALKAGGATTIALTFENTDLALTRTLGTFSASLQPATVSSYGQATTNGAVTNLGTVDLGGATLAPGAKTYASITVTPPVAGDTFAFAMRVSFTDPTKQYDGGHTFLTAINP
jgi:hypothetical protein